MSTATITTATQRLQMARFIVDREARLDAAGHLKVYKLPAGDGGGSYEIAGINDRYHLNQAEILRCLLLEGKYDEALESAVHYIANYTDIASRWTRHPATEAFVRDCVFNRGPGGALRILQSALGVAADGKYGPKTARASDLAHTDGAKLLLSLRQEREAYERRIAPPVGARAKFWKGLVNRWDAALKFAQSFL